MDKGILEKLKTDTLPILRQKDVKSALFGSYVRRDNTQENDIDILVELPDNTTLFELGELKITLEEKLNKKVEVVTYKSILPIIKDSVLNNQYPLL